MYARKQILTYALLAAVAITGLQCSDDDSETKSANKSITSFKLSALTPAVTATVDESAKTIALSVPTGTNVTALVATVEVSADASVSPASGTAQNFTNPVTYTVTAADGTKQAYVVTVTVGASQAAACYPTLLPLVDEVVGTITYTADHRVATATFTEELEEEGDGFRAEYVYTDGKVSRINYFHGDEAVNYTTFTYGTSTITESYYADENEDGVREITNYYVYYLTDGRVTSWSYRTPNRKTRLDSAAFIYTGDNVTRTNGFGSSDTQEWYHTFEYDDKINPLYQSGLNSEGGDDGYLIDPIALSKNNVTFWDSHSKNYTETINYTYNDKGLPLTKHIVGDVERSYEYSCQ